MNLVEFLKNHPNVKLACTEEDERELLKLYNKTNMAGKAFDLSYDRSPVFSKFLDFNLGKKFIFMFMDKGKLAGSGSFILRDGWQNGSKVKFLYNGDLRTNNTRGVTKIWRNFYRDFILNMNDISDFKDSVHTYAVIISDNSPARNTLEKKFQYNHVNTFKMKNILFKKIKLFMKLHKCSLSSNLKDGEILLNNFYKNKFLGYHIRLTELSKKWFYKDYYGLYLVRNENNEIIGGSIIWSPRSYKKIILHINNSFLKFLVSVISKVYYFPKNQQELKPLYLSHIFFHDGHRDKVYNSLINKALELKKIHQYHVVSVQDLEKNSLWSKNYYSIDKEINLYVVGQTLDKSQHGCFEISLA